MKAVSCSMTIVIVRVLVAASQILNFIKSNEILSFRERFVSSINNFFLIEDEKSAVIELMTERFNRVGGE